MNSLKLLPLLLIGILIWGIGSCSKSKTAEPDVLVCPPDSTYTYLADVEPILADQCGGCHYASFGSVSANVNIEGYDNAKAESRTECVITYDNGCVGMPQSGKMNDSLISVIRCWIRSGYPR